LPRPRLIFSSLPPDFTTENLSQVLKNLPPGVSIPSHLNHSNLRATDVKVLVNQHGRSRRMAFVGFKSEPEASWIKQIWDGTWLDNASGSIGGSRISVDWAKTVKQCASITAILVISYLLTKVPALFCLQNSLARSPKRRKASTTGAALLESSQNQNPVLSQFASLIGSTKNKSLVQEISEAASAAPDNLETPSISATSLAKLSNGGSKGETPTLNPVESSPPPVVGDDDELDNRAYLSKRMKRTLGESFNDLEQLQPISCGGDRQWDQKDIIEMPLSRHDDNMKGMEEKSEQSPDDLILESGRLFIRNLPYSVSEDELMQLFRPYSPLTQIHIPLDPNRQPKGLAYVSFEKPQSALKAFKALDQVDFQGRLLHLLPAINRNLKRGDSQLEKTVKSGKESKRLNDSNKGFNWASLYMNPDAVINSVADRLKISKSELLDSKDQSPAVKLALAETSAVSETKKFFEDNGINTEVFDQTHTARSSTTLLVKNIPYGTTSSAVKNIFSDHGYVSRVIMPPTGTIAVVEMSELEAAREAFKSLAYKRIGNSVIYLEKAPKGLWKAGKVDNHDSQLSLQHKSEIERTENTAEDQGEAGSTLFVKNLSFSTTSELLSTYFKRFPGYLFCRIQTKSNPKNPINRLSMGFGFIGFKTVDQAQHALKVMQGTLVEGHALELKFANQNIGEIPEDHRSGNSTSASHKLIIKNLPFEINKKELFELFESFGKLKTIRIPKKVDRKSRGFGFVEYVSANSAKDAIKSLRHSHLLGRHLIIEYANQSDQSIEQIRSRTGAELFRNKIELQKTKFKGLENVSGDGDHTSE
ncbi:multiple RNA-binding domain-containing protein 1, partial [Phakopsora pachyrhizi]